MDDTSRRVSDAEHRGASGEDLDEVGARRAREIRSEIEQTREDMSETIDAIQEKLRPGNIAAAASDRLRDVAGTAVRNAAEAASGKAQRAMKRTRRVADDLADGGRMNTIASAMIGIGSAWLLVERWRNSGQRPYGSLSDYAYGDERYRPRWARPPGVGEYEADVASDEGVIAQSYDRASSMAHEARDRARETARRARSGFANLLESNPLMVGAAAMAVGATIGLALPETERENEWMGEAKDNLMERAQDVARGTVSEVRQAAGEIAGQLVGGEKAD